jgi:hypothetical protein
VSSVLLKITLSLYRIVELNKIYRSIERNVTSVVTRDRKMKVVGRIECRLKMSATIPDGLAPLIFAILFKTRPKYDITANILNYPLKDQILYAVLRSCGSLKESFCF